MSSRIPSCEKTTRHACPTNADKEEIQGKLDALNDDVVTKITVSPNVPEGAYMAITSARGANLPRLARKVNATIDDEPSWSKVEAASLTALFPGDRKPDPLESPFERVGPDAVLSLPQSFRSFRSGQGLSILKTATTHDRAQTKHQQARPNEKTPAEGAVRVLLLPESDVLLLDL